MSSTISWIFVITVFLLTSWVIFSGFLSVTDDQSSALREANETQLERLKTAVSIKSAAITLSNEKCGTFTVDTLVANSGDVSIAEFSEMDIVMAYTDDSGSKASVRHQYVSGDLSSNQRTVSGISPNNFGVNVWDPDETATIKSRLLPLPKPNSFGTVLVAEPQGATDSSYVYFAINDCRFLHNNHTPPTGDTARQPDLPMDDTLPTAATLHNYDQDADANPGCTINKGAVGPGETDIAKYQDWRTGVLSSPLSLTGTIAVDLWASLQQYAPDKAGVVTIYFRDYDGSSHTEIGQGTIFDVDWQGGTSNFVRKVILIPGFNYTVPAGNELEVKLVVGNVSASEMWFAYDTQAYQSLINLSYIAPTYTTFYHLHNDPTPPTGNTAAQAVLPMSTTAPTATTLYNYDTNYDTNAGRVLQKTPQGLNETVLQKHQVWRSGALAGGLVITGDASIDLWGAIKDFGQDKTGIVTAYLRDFNGTTHQEIGHGTVYAADWQDGSTTWVKRSIQMPELSYTIPSGNELELFLVVENQSDAEMWFAYDTVSYSAVIKIS